ncbi:alpha/beta hydrolase [Spectribacter hydrogenoxidans]|uniref:Alpha/beta hydrolase n=1 Tax=Spectribacter hydrogenoxidans TaxID=3075608 RepID=A0ABU3BYT5_9GAMM|nr:alpha/beta hydrolase [Salinisphaera sp. W335]MDT0634471.1 alpha/beta hydrolase [Salinisphaera sp. W335]
MLDKQLEAVMQMAAEQGAPDFSDLEPPECRAFFKEFVTSVDLPQGDVDVDNRTIPGPGGDLAIRIYKPKGSGPHPILMYFHGGGWVIGGLDDYNGVASNLAEKAGCVTIAVDYRLAPEHPYPAAVEDCYAALEWAAANAGEIGADASRIAVSGDSAGGTLATVCAMLARDNNGPKISYQALVYPVTQTKTGGFPSYDKYGEGHLLTNRAMDYFRKHYLDGASEPLDFRVDPLNHGRLADLPPALVLVAGFDPLHDEGIAYAEKMNEAGVHVVVADYPSVAHGFFMMGGALEASRQAVDQAAGAVRRALAA